MLQSRLCSLYTLLGADLGLDLSLDIPILADWLSSSDLLSVVRRLSAYGRAVDSGLISGYYTPIPDIRHVGSIPVLFRRAFKRVFRSDGSLLPDASANAVFPLRQLTSFVKKIDLPCVMSPQEAWSGFVDRQCSLRSKPLPTSHPILQRARQLAHRFCNWDLQHITPGHGPGAVAESLDRDERYIFPNWYSPAERVYPRGEYGRLAYGSTRLSPSASPATTRVVTVPKDFRKLRLISVEPASQQFLQQGQMRLLYRLMERSPLGRFCSVNDQSRNRKLALVPGHSTIDLSDASDYVSASLVAFLFPKRLRRQLFSTRSVLAQFQARETVRLYSFAPMGSAVCFPVETLVFTLLAMAAWDYMFPKDRRFSLSLSVFGDDIVCEDSLEPILTCLFSEIGMKVNTLKCCTSSSFFRETCGAEYWKHEDVSIVKNRGYLFEPVHTPSLISTLALQRELFKKSLFASAKYLLLECRRHFPVPSTCVLDCPEGFALGETDFQPCRLRYNKGYQRTEVLAPRTCLSTRGWRVADEHVLFARLLGDSMDRVPTRDRKVRFGWNSALEKS